MIKPLLLFKIVCLSFFLANGQTKYAIDSVEISLAWPVQISKESEPLLLHVKYFNRSNRDVEVYDTLVESSADNQFSNISIQFEKFDGVKYNEYKWKTNCAGLFYFNDDSLRYYDVKKSALKPSGTRDLLLKLSDAYGDLRAGKLPNVGSPENRDGEKFGRIQ